MSATRPTTTAHPQAGAFAARQDAHCRTAGPLLGPRLMLPTPPAAYVGEGPSSRPTCDTARCGMAGVMITAAAHRAPWKMKRPAAARDAVALPQPVSPAMTTTGCQPLMVAEDGGLRGSTGAGVPARLPRRRHSSSRLCLRRSSSVS